DSLVAMTKKAAPSIDAAAHYYSTYEILRAATSGDTNQANPADAHERQAARLGYKGQLDVVKINLRLRAVTIDDQTETEESLASWDVVSLGRQGKRNISREHLAACELGTVEFNFLTGTWEVLRVISAARVDIRTELQEVAVIAGR